jgi:hypothetical protein
MVAFQTYSKISTCIFRLLLRISYIFGFILQEDEKENGKWLCFKNLEDRERARMVDKISRVIFPAVFIVFNIVYWLVYVFWEPDPA